MDMDLHLGSLFKTANRKTTKSAMLPDQSSAVVKTADIKTTKPAMTPDVTSAVLTPTDLAQVKNSPEAQPSFSMSVSCIGTGVDLTLLDVTSKTDLIKLQKQDATCAHFMHQDVVEPFPTNMPFYYMSDGILMHRMLDKKRLREFSQAVMPKVLRNDLLCVAHDIPAAGHLAAAKIKARLTPHFFWPKQSKEVLQYVWT
jgi:hypothetical protein